MFYTTFYFLMLREFPVYPKVFSLYVGGGGGQECYRYGKIRYKNFTENYDSGMLQQIGFKHFFVISDKKFFFTVI
jgi:hypothetical protein